MDKQTIIIGGVGLGVILLILGGRSKTGSGNSDVLVAAVQGMSIASATEPALLEGYARLEDGRLHARNESEANLLSFMAKFADTEASVKAGNSDLAKTAINASSITKLAEIQHDTDKYVAETDRILGGYSLVSDRLKTPQLIDLEKHLATLGADVTKFTSAQDAGVATHALDTAHNIAQNELLYNYNLGQRAMTIADKADRKRTGWGSFAKNVLNPGGGLLGGNGADAQSEAIGK